MKYDLAFAVLVRGDDPRDGRLSGEDVQLAGARRPQLVEIAHGSLCSQCVDGSKNQCLPQGISAVAALSPESYHRARTNFRAVHDPDRRKHERHFDSTPTPVAGPASDWKPNKLMGTPTAGAKKLMRLTGI